MTSVSRLRTSKRTEPNQKRSQRTNDQILTAAAELLGNVGFEKLSTNMICKRAGLTPPALYRYYPNKYAVLKALGEQLMARQNALLENWELNTDRPAAIERDLTSLIAETARITRETRSGEWIMRSLHATPVLADVRIKSHRVVAQALTERVILKRPDLDQACIYREMRLGVELAYAALEMLFDEPTLDETAVIESAAGLLSKHLLATLTA